MRDLSEDREETRVRRSGRRRRRNGGRRTEQRERRPLDRLRRYGAFSVVAVIVSAVILWAIFQALSPSPGLRLASLGNLHIESVDAAHVPYNSVPPTSGPHIGLLARGGVHEDPIPNELQVHNLEDGYVMAQYNCPETCENLVYLLEVIALGYQKVIVAPYPDMESRIALTAWQRIETLEDFEEERITRFIDAYVDIDHHVR